MVPQTVVAVRKVYGHGRVQIPVEVRRRLGLEDGDKLIFIQSEGEYSIRKAEVLLEPPPPLARTTKR